MQQDTRAEIARLEARLCAETKLREQAFAMRDQTLALQGKEYERRLEGLNHEAARITASQAKSVEAGYFEARMVAITDRLQVVERSMSSGGGRITGFAEVKKDFFSIAALLISIGMGLYVIFGK